MKQRGVFVIVALLSFLIFKSVKCFAGGESGVRFGGIPEMDSRIITPNNSGELESFSADNDVNKAFNSSVYNLQEVINSINKLPEFTSEAIVSVLEDSVYTYHIKASDANGDVLMITADNLPSWLTLIDNYDGTAVLTGTPDNMELGVHVVELEVTDAFSTSTQSFEIEVYNTNDVPVFTSAELLSVAEDKVYGFSIKTQDDDDDALMISAKNLPSWLTLTDNDDGTATLLVSPDNNEEGIYNIELEVTDAFTTSTQSYILSVNNESVSLYSRVH